MSKRPFSPEDLEQYLQLHPQREAAALLIREASKDLSRDVGKSGFPSGITEHQSTKTMVTVNTESESGELAYAHILDFDDNVITYYEQVPPVDCLREDKNGRRVQRAYRADFVVLTNQGPEIIQVKSAKEIREKIAKYPATWIETDGEVCDLAANRAFEALGLPHRVVQSCDLPQVRIANIRALIRARDYEMGDEESAKEAVIECVAKKSVALISQIVEELAIKDHTAILKLIVEKKIFIDMDRQLVVQPESCWISDCEVLLEKLVFEQLRSGVDMARAEVSISRVPTRKHAEIALERLEEFEKNPSSRNSRRLRAIILNNPEVSIFQALIPKYYLSGNRLPKRPENVLEHVNESLREHFGTPKRSRPNTAYRFYRASAAEIHPTLTPVSKPTYVAKRDDMRMEIAIKRGGRRMGNAAANPTDVDDRLIRATRPFEWALVDSCLLKIYCILLETENDIYVCRPNLFAMRDCFSKFVLARWISFSAPSRRTTAILMRVCGRRFGRLPETISADSGSDTKNVFFSSLCAHAGVSYNKRRPEDSRYGSLIERFFGEFTTTWLDHRPGNRTDVKTLRQISSTHHPENLPCMGLPNLLGEFDQFAEWKNNECLGDHISSSSVLLKDGLERFPFSGIPVTYDEQFILATAVDGKSLALDPQRGIKHGNEHYWHPELAGLNPRRNVDIRIEPEDHTRIYAKVSDHWVTCKSTRNNIFRTLLPLHGESESILVLEGNQIRSHLKERQDMALVKIAREADRRFAEKQGTAHPSQIAPEQESQDSLWATVRREASLGVSISQWGSGS